MPTMLQQLQEWYLAQCDGDWEHTYGVEIGTLDNPGWRVRIGLAETDLEEDPFERIKIERTDDDWLHAWVEDRRWHAACGPKNLDEALRAFLTWANSS
jgi:hypothetical protein